MADLEGTEAVGNCYEVAIEAAKLLKSMLNAADVRVGHGLVPGHGPLSGYRVGHAWAQGGGYVVTAGGKSGVAFLPMREFTDIIDIGDWPVALYTLDEAKNLLRETGHAGPWDERIHSAVHIDSGRVMEERDDGRLYYVGGGPPDGESVRDVGVSGEACVRHSEDGDASGVHARGGS